MMKKILALTIALMLCLLALPVLAESAASEPSVVTALGSATVTLTPDMATFTVGVTTQEMLVAKAQSANAKLMQSLLAALKAKGVAAEDLQTDNYTINAVYAYQNGKLDNQQVLQGYSVSNNVTVTVRALDQLPALLDASVAAGANQTYGITFLSSQNATAYDQALAAATQDAVRKATLIAKALNRQPGAVRSAVEANDVYNAYASNKAIAYDAASATPIESGTLSVTANVRVELALE